MIEVKEDILNSLDIFVEARRQLILELKQLGFSDEQAYVKIMRYQTETHQMNRTFKEKPNDQAVYDWQGRKKITVTHKDLDAEA